MIIMTEIRQDRNFFLPRARGGLERAPTLYTGIPLVSMFDKGAPSFCCFFLKNTRFFAKNHVFFCSDPTLFGQNIQVFHGFDPCISSIRRHTRIVCIVWVLLFWTGYYLQSVINQAPALVSQTSWTMASPAPRAPSELCLLALWSL